MRLLGVGKFIFAFAVSSDGQWAEEDGEIIFCGVRENPSPIVSGRMFVIGPFAVGFHWMS